MMLTAPKVLRHNKKRYMAIRSKVSMEEISSAIPPLIPKVFACLAEKNINAYGPPFFRYLSFEDGRMTIEAGVVVNERLQNEGEFVAGSFPAGNYASITHFGDYKYLKDAHMSLEAWIKHNGLVEKQQPLENGVRWAARAEFYKTENEKDIDPEKWDTDVEFLLDDDK